MKSGTITSFGNTIKIPKSISVRKALVKFIRQLQHKFLTKTLLTKVLITVGALAIILLIAAASLILYVNSVVATMDKSSKEYVNEIVPAISTNWDENALKSRASREFMSSTNEAELHNFFALLEKKLGKMKVFMYANGYSNVFINLNKQEITAKYIAYTEFEKAKAQIIITLIRKDDTWEILGYRVNSEVFNPNFSQE